MQEKLSVFDYESYQTYLSAQFGANGTRNGKRLQFATKLGVHPSYISLVLKGSSHLSLEQAMEANVFFGHIKEEAEFFVLLVSRDRAGSVLLRKHFQEKIDQVYKLRSQVESRVKGKERLLTEIKEEYYSSYLYSAVFVLASIPEFRSTANIAKALRVPVSTVESVFSFLLRSGILEKSSGGVRPGKKTLHLNRGDVNLKKHHTNWRVHSLHAMDKNSELGLHYSSCFSLSQKDAEKFNSLLLENLDYFSKMVGQSKEEVGYVYNFDFYPLVD